MSKAIRIWSDEEKRFITDNIKADFSTGVLYWKRNQPTRKAKAGDPVNVYLTNPKPRQYLYFALYPDGFTQRNYRVHHVVFFLFHNRQPLNTVDHIDGNQLNNRPDNLREVTASQNSQNSLKRKRTTRNPYKGAHSRNGGKSFVSAITKGGRSYHLGSFPDPLEAATCYDLASLVLHGDYGKRNFPDSIYSPSQIASMKRFIDSRFC